MEGKTFSENLNHETGGTLSSRDILTEQCVNTKLIIIQSSTPSQAYDGQVFEDTDDDPPHIQVYDLTNTQWMTLYPCYYVDDAEGYKPVTDTDHGGYTVSNGTLSVQRDSTNNHDILYFHANSVWYGLQEV